MKPKASSPKKEKEATKEESKPAKSSSQNGKPLASIFQKPVKVEKPKDEDEHVPVEEEGEDEISDEEMEEQEEKAASKL